MKDEIIEEKILRMLHERRNGMPMRPQYRQVEDIPPYDECAACSGPLTPVAVDAAHRTSLQACRKCSGVHMRSMDKDMIKKVIKIDQMVQGNAMIYFDVMYVKTDGATKWIDRMHGWMNEEHQVVQFG
jgi:hypothetical protein